MPELTIIEQPLLDRYASAWDALVDQAPLPTPFLRSWWLEHTSLGRPVFVLALDGEELVGGIALQEERRPGGTRLRFMGSGPLCPDHLDLLAAPGREPEVVDTLRRSMAARGPAIVDLDGMRSGALVTACFDAPMLKLSAQAPYLVLDGTAPLAERPSRVRNTVQRTTRRLAKLGVESQVVSPDDADRAFEALRTLHNERWGDASRFSPVIDRFEAAARVGMTRGELVIHELATADDAEHPVVAVCVVLRVAGRASFYQAGRLTEPEWRGAGTAVLAASIEAAAAAGCHEYDLLRGDEPYKQDWSSGHRDLYRLVAGVGGRRAGASVLAASIDARQRFRPYVHRARELIERGRSRFLTPPGACRGAHVKTAGPSVDRPLRVVIAGGEAAGQRVLKGLATGRHEVVAAFAGSGPTGAPVRGEAARHGVPVLPAVRVKDPSVVAELGPIDLLVNVHSLFVITPELLDWPTLGAFNVHPGWLPEFAGRNCPSWAVWLGEREPGVTVHRMVAEIDRGDVAFQDRFSAGTGATGGSVAVECAKRGIVLINRLVDALVAGDLDLRPQDPRAFTYFGRDVPDEGHFRPERTAVELDRLVRACDYGPFASPWGTPLAWVDAANVGIRRVLLTGVSADAPPGTIRHDADQVLVACADEWLEVTSVTVEGKQALPSSALSNAVLIGSSPRQVRD